jgi:hypothetical protein
VGLLAPLTRCLFVALAMAACEDETQPPLLGDCTGKNCTPIIVGGGGGVVDGGCGFSSSNPTCANCLTLSCCGPDGVCAANVSCVGLVECIDNCASNDTICQNDCALTYDGGVVEYDNLAMCVQNNCNIACAPDD